MNWYKTAQNNKYVGYDYENEISPYSHSQYMDIAHTTRNRKQKLVILFYHNGKKIVQKTVSNTDLHHKIFDNHDYFISGRVDIDKNIGSIAVNDTSFSYRNENINNIDIINMLYDIKEEFPEIQFYVFQSSNNYGMVEDREEYSEMKNNGIYIDQYIKNLSQSKYASKDYEENNYFDIGHDHINHVTSPNRYPTEVISNNIIYYIHDGKKVLSTIDNEKINHSMIFRNNYDLPAKGRIEIENKIGSIGLYPYRIRSDSELLNILYDIKEAFPDIQFYVYSNRYNWGIPSSNDTSKLSVDEYIKQVSS